MKVAVVTDGRYRSSIAAVRALGRAGYRVVVTQTKKETRYAPASFSSVFVSEGRWIEGSCKDRDYPEKLRKILMEYQRPVLFCTGADSLNAVSREREHFAEVADFLIAPPDVLDALNDKQIVHHRAEELKIPVPREFSDVPDSYPVVIKPHCGEKAGLKAAERYIIASNRADYEKALKKMHTYDDAPIVQEKLTGDGEGVNILMDRDGTLLCAYCHRRVREYPSSGGPSTCCESFYDEKMIRDAHALLASFGFCGMAMVEFKAGRVLEVNPRVWGSFPMGECCGSPFTARYASAAEGKPMLYTAGDYREKVRMRYLFNDAMAVIDYFRKGKPGMALGGIRDFFTVSEALYRRDDRKAFRAYLKNSVRDR